MTSTSIYTEFKPTYLYIKQHKITGKLYFGKTFSERGPIKYSGSGVHWNRHKRVHGNSIKDIDTLWFCLFTDQQQLIEFADLCSIQWNIVESTKWLNKIPESGLGAGCGKGSKTKEHSKNISIGKIGKSINLIVSDSRKLELAKEQSEFIMCYDTLLNSNVKIIKELFDNVRYVYAAKYHTKGWITVFDITKQEFTRITKEEFYIQSNPRRYVGNRSSLAR